MLAILFATIYISIVCWVWGTLQLRLINLLTQQVFSLVLPFPLVCIIGLASISVLLGFISLFSGLDNWILHLLACTPVLITLTRQSDRNELLREVNSIFGYRNSFVSLGVVVSVLLLFIMSSWIIIHPDTIGYHAPIIAWIKKYPVIPGLVNLYPRYGFQNSWFILCSFFSFGFTGVRALTFVNTCFLVWYVLTLFFFLDKALTLKESAKAFTLLVLIAVSFWGYTQVRLTATSASPDFIAAVVCWMVVFLFLVYPPNALSYIVISLLATTAVTFKLSSVAIALFPLYICARLVFRKSFKTALAIVCYVIITAFPFVLRNYLTTGYLLFPATSLTIGHPDWQYNKTKTEMQDVYVTAYAKTAGDLSAPADIYREARLPLRKWFPVWWKHQSAADKITLSLDLLLLLIAALSLGKIRSIVNSPTIVAFGILITGSIFWFIKAPDPRFGLSYTIPLFFILLYLLLKTINRPSSLQYPTIFCLALLAVGLFGYGVYRCLFYMSWQYILQPAGVDSAYITEKPWDPVLNGKAEVKKAFDTSARHTVIFQPRGARIEDGFKP